MKNAFIVLALLAAPASPAVSRAAGVAREAPEPAEEISTWTAPPYWTPPAAPSSGSSGRDALAGGRSPLAAGPTALPFIALPPCRIIDTRGNAPMTGGYLPAATVRSYTVTGVCGIPANAAALSLNATVVHPTGPGFLTLYPQGGSFPTVSTLNFLGNDVIVNAAVVPLSASGGISMALGVSGGDVILDTNGYYAPLTFVRSLSGVSGDVALAAGSNVTITPAGSTLTIASTGGVTLAGSGTATTASHSDHNHIGNTWSGSGGLFISSTDANNPALTGSAPQWGVQGGSYSSNPLSAGVLGTTTNAGGNGVYGDGGPGTGVRGVSTGNNGIWGTSSSAVASGVYAENTSGGYALAARVSGTGSFGWAVLAETSTAGGRAVFGRALGAATEAARFEGNVDVTGNLSKGGGSFKIDHPLDPANKYLYHSFVESPDMMNIYDGVVTTDEKGYATVPLPEWFEALNRDFRYQLTVLDESDGATFVHAKIVKGVASSRFTLRTSEPNTRISWLVTGIRKDAWANDHRIPVEEPKPEGERGRYLHPKEHGRPPEEAIVSPAPGGIRTAP